MAIELGCLDRRYEEIKLSRQLNEKGYCNGNDNNNDNDKGFPFLISFAFLFSCLLVEQQTCIVAK